MKRIAIIGAGISGITLANKLRNHASVDVYEKSAAVGGRLASYSQGGRPLNYGAQFFTAKSSSWQNFIKPLLHNNIISSWNVPFAEINQQTIQRSYHWHNNNPHYTAPNGMRSVVQWLAQSCSVTTNCHITHLVAKPHQRWQLFSAERPVNSPYDWVITATPPAYATQLLPDSFHDKQAINAIDMLPCYNLQLITKQSLSALPWQAALVKNSVLSWVAILPTTTGSGTCISCHSSNAWAMQHLDKADNVVSQAMLLALSNIVGQQLIPHYSNLHRWKYANIMKQAGSGYFIDHNQHLAVCGDWCIRGTVENGFLSASRLADLLHNYI